MAHTGASPHSHSNGARQPNVFNCGLSEPVVLWLVKASCFAPCKSHLARVIQPFLMWPNKCESVLFECKGVGLRRRHACLHETPSTCRSVRPSCAGAPQSTARTPHCLQQASVSTMACGGGGRATALADTSEEP